MRLELNATSSQDQFAKWAKLKRQHDKLLEQLEKKSTSPETLTSVCPILVFVSAVREGEKANVHCFTAEQAMAASRQKFDTYLNVARILLTRAPHYLIPLWYAKEPMFWLPSGLFPYYAEWFLSLPKAPLGSVSIMSWQVACTAIIKLMSETVAAVYALVVGSKTKEKEPVKVPGRTAQGAQNEKKEL